MNIKIHLLLLVLTCFSIEAKNDYTLQIQRNHQFPITCVKIAHNDSVFATGDRQGIVKVWRLYDGKLLKDFSNSSNPIADMDFSNTGDTLVVASGNEVFLWDISNGKLIRKYNQHQFKVTSVSFSRNNNKLLTCGIDKHLYINDLVDTNSNPFQLKNEYSFLKAGYLNGGNNYYIIDEKGYKILKTGVSDLNKSYIIKDIGSLKVITKNNGNVLLYGDNYRKYFNHEMKELFEFGSKYNIFSVFNVNNDADIFIGYDTVNYKMLIANKFLTKKYYEKNDSINPVVHIDVANNNKYIVLIYDDKKIEILKKGILSNEFKSSYEIPASPVRYFSRIHSLKDLSYCVFTNENNVIQLNTITQRPVVEFKTSIGGIFSSVNVNDSIYLVSGNDDEILAEINTKTRKVNDEKYVFENIITKMYYDKTSNYLITFEIDAGIKVIDYSKRTNLQQILTNYDVSELYYLPKIRQVVVADYSGNLYFYDMTSGVMVRKTKITKDRITKILYDSLLNNLILATIDGQLCLHNLDKLKNIYFQNSENENEKVFLSPIADVYLDYANSRIIALSKNNLLKILTSFDLSQITKYYLNENTSIMNFDINNYDVMAILNYDGRINYYKLGSNLDYIGTLLIDELNEWVAIDRNGNYEGTPGIIEKMHFSKGKEIISINSLFNNYYKKNVLTNILIDNVTMGKEDIFAIKIPKIINTNEVNGKTKIFVNPNNNKIKCLTVKNKGKVIDEIFSYIQEDKNIVFEINQNKYNYNPIELSVLTESEIESEIYSIQTDKLLDPKNNTINKIYFVGLTIDNYKDEKLKLKYAYKDSKKLYEEIQNHVENISYIELKDIISSKDVVRLFDSVSNIVKPNDKMIIYVASHGLSEYNAGSNYKILLSDYSHDKQNSNNVFKFNELAKSINLLKSSNILLILNTCNSGSANEILDDNYNNNNEYGKLARKNGFNMIAASASKSSTWELDILKGSVFNKVLIDALKQNRKNMKSIKEYLLDNLPSESSDLVNEPQIPFIWLNPSNQFILE